MCVVFAVVAVSIDDDALTLWCFGNFLLYRSTAEKVVEEVRRQLKETPGIMTREVKPDYQRCVAIVTDAALKEMVLPGCLAVVMPVTVGLIFRALGKGVVVVVVVVVAAVVVAAITAVTAVAAVAAGSCSEYWFYGTNNTHTCSPFHSVR